MNGDYSEFSSRGVAAWPAGATANNHRPDAGDSLRLFVGAIDGRLIALDGRAAIRNGVVCWPLACLRPRGPGGDNRPAITGLSTNVNKKLKKPVFLFVDC
jgi:hypothetical protein